MTAESDTKLPPARRLALIAARDHGSIWRAHRFTSTSAFRRMADLMAQEGLIEGDGSLTAAGRALIGQAEPAERSHG